jgi:asparagine synthase (glutamine-hydrolysing)
MCGIVGFVTVRPHADTSWLRRACDTMRHRGPDAQGIWHDEYCALGHRRLSIIDLSTGAQPMSDADDRYRIVFNGEIYNYRELKRQLVDLGHSFRTESDTEVVLAAHAQWGRQAGAHLRGIFAFAIWDRIDRSLTLTRDHFGVKPLLYCSRPDTLTFGSELKVMLAAGVRRDIDPTAVSDFLALGYVLGAKTILRGIRRVEPGSTIIWRDGRYAQHQYFDLAVAAQEGTASGNAVDYVREYADRLDEAVTSQMVSDVPVGAFLSGGLDSSSVVYFMGRRASQPLQTFSMGFDEPSFSELPYAAEAASALKTEHHAEVISGGLADELPSLIRAFDEPLGDTSIVPTYFVSRVASRFVKVVLSGDGADETLAGYDTYVADALHRWYARIPRGARHDIVRPFGRFIPDSRRKVSLNYKLKQFIAQADENWRRAHYGWRLLFPDADRLTLLGGAAPDHDPFTEYDTYFDDVRGASELNQALYVDIKTWLANDILVKVDRASMSVGLEARVPFLDPALVEFSLRLPSRMKMQGLRRKIVLRRAMRSRLPETVLRRRKSGFNAPVSDWMRGSLRPLVEDVMAASSSIVDVHHPDVRRIWAEHLSGRADYGFRLWALLVLLLWEREVFRMGLETQVSAEAVGR